MYQFTIPMALMNFAPVASFVCAMGMGFMSSQDSTLAWVNWAEQSINCISQGCLMAGVRLLHKAGLKGWIR